ncbi:LPS export ABC transporter periplasmic protein LptC [Alteromonas oceanisediminis]|uniref:LPS export ABC transporter periplasmic protein LptC n=1 Tax=Alteromonas oceanisediminis TaxID=2836180 RepID=UPI001BDB5179|nr:LPS export ABC transporter periplasmic protein LptC [Alteromonas oceanisediminis]MBT0585441.1 LPS export ABC transporter periplasmic protein LptC [Alteromonas oceanisediminis]
MNRITYSISALFILALATYLPTWFKDEQEMADDSAQDAWQPTYQAKNLRSALYDEDGRLTHRVFASEMEHYDQLGFVFFKQPQYTIYMEEQQKPWQLTAQEGTLYDDDRIQLERDVVIQTLSDDNFVKTIRTQYIQVMLDTKKMLSDQPVIIEGADYEIQSNGFEADLNTKEYELKRHVQTVYLPQKKAS